jgi:hypothetical protein
VHKYSLLPEEDMKKWITLFIPLLLLLLAPTGVLAQTYLFSLDNLDTNVFINDDGSASIDYRLTFTNAPQASPIEFVDVGLPTSHFDESSITADVNGVPVGVSKSEYQGNGSGIAVVMGAQAIPPGQTGTVHVLVPRVESWLRKDSKDKSYASFEFSPLWFGKEYLTGAANTSVTIHFPSGVLSEEPRWHSAPDGFPAEPATGVDEQGRMIYTWQNPSATAYEQHDFGVSFPAQYVPASAISSPSLWETLGIKEETFYTFLCCGGFFALIFGLSYWGKVSANKRKLQYLPPKVSIEGLGIKRGLTSVEAAILMEQPLEKILTMILFSVIKKSAATVIKREPLTLQISDPAPQGLYDYETSFLNAFKKPDGRERQLTLQETTIDLVQSVSNKMKGFSRKETVAYYRDIIERAWKQVEASQTPEVKSKKYDEVMEWTMLDRDYEDRTRDVFRSGPVFIPTWWGRFDPGYGRPATGGAPKTMASPAPSIPGGKGGISLPTLPGATFAASMANSVQNFSSGVIGNVTDFTSKITNKTNPAPVSTTSSGSIGSRGSSGGHSCACACACAGCACACAGGGR